MKATKLQKEVLRHGAECELERYKREYPKKTIKKNYIVFNGKVIYLKFKNEKFISTICAYQLYPYKHPKVELMSIVGLAPNA